MEKASDAPDQVGEILRLRLRVDMNVQTQTNLSRVSANVNTAEATVREAISIVERARVIAAETATTGAPTRKALALETRQLHDRLITIAGTVAEGRYVFAGDGASGPPYVADATSPTGAKLASGAATSSALVVDERNTPFSVSRTASDLFDAPGAANVFQALEDLTKALSADSETDVQASIGSIVNSLNHLNQQLAFYGNAQNRVASAIDSAKKNSVALHRDLSKLQETDLPAAILELNAAKLHHEAALMSQSKIPRSTLFDYLG